MKGGSGSNLVEVRGVQVEPMTTALAAGRMRLVAVCRVAGRLN